MKESADYHYWLGRRFHNENPALAIMHYTEAIKMAPGHIDAHQFRYICWIKLNNYDQVEIDLDKVLELTGVDPNSIPDDYDSFLENKMRLIAA